MSAAGVPAEQGGHLMPLPRLLVILSVTTGLVDATSVIGLGKVFTANMTGNVVFLGLALAGTPGFHVDTCIVAVLAFLVGAAIAGRVGRVAAAWPLGRRLMLAAGCETALLWLAAWTAAGWRAVGDAPDGRMLAIVALTALAMGWRNGTVRTLGVADLTTTVLTLGLTGLAADSRLAGGAAPNRGRRIAGVLAIFAGALAGALAIGKFGLSLPLVAAGAIGLAATILCALEAPSPPQAEPAAGAS